MTHPAALGCRVSQEKGPSTYTEPSGRGQAAAAPSRESLPCKEAQPPASTGGPAIIAEEENRREVLRGETDISSLNQTLRDRVEQRMKAKSQDGGPEAIQDLFRRLIENHFFSIPFMNIYTKRRD